MSSQNTGRETMSVVMAGVSFVVLCVITGFAFGGEWGAGGVLFTYGLLAAVCAGVLYYAARTVLGDFHRERY